MKILKFIKNLFKKKRLYPKEIVVFHGLPIKVELDKKNLMLMDIVDTVIISNESPVSYGEVNLSHIKPDSNDTVNLDFMFLSQPIPEGTNLKIELNGILYNPKTQVIEYNFISEISNVTRINEYRVSFFTNNIKTTIVSTEKR